MGLFFHQVLLPPSTVWGCQTLMATLQTCPLPMVAKCSLWFVFLIIVMRYIYVYIYISGIYFANIFFLPDHLIIPFDQKKEGYLYGYWLNIKRKKMVILQI